MDPSHVEISNYNSERKQSECFSFTDCSMASISDQLLYMPSSFESNSLLGDMEVSLKVRKSTLHEELD